VNEDKATRYHRSKRRASMLSLAWSVVLLIGLMATRATVALRTTAESFASWAPRFLLVPATAIVYLALVTAINEIVDMPVAFYSGFTLEKRYGLSNEGIAAWLGDHAKSLALGFTLSACGAAIVYGLIVWSPDWWWLIAAIVFACVFVGLTQVAPVVVLPLFYRVKPLERDSLRTRLLALAERAGARVVGAYEWGLGERTRKANAALAGIGATRRILVSDTMLAEYSDEEIEVVLAHELAHHVHGDIWKGIAFESVLIIGGFYAAARALSSFSGSIGLRNPADVAGLPLLLLAAGAVSLLTVPLAHALSRAYERRADRFALELTRNPQAFISAMRRLGAQNLAEEDPSTLVQWLFYSHPPIRERIRAAQAFR
jgi:STE24 endopeptidase